MSCSRLASRIGVPTSRAGVIFKAAIWRESNEVIYKAKTSLAKLIKTNQSKTNKTLKNNPENKTQTIKLSTKHPFS